MWGTEVIAEQGKTDRRRLLAGLAGGALLAGVPAPTRGAADRIATLIGRMTVAEKAGQLSCFTDEIRPVAAVFNPVIDARGAAAMLAEVQAGRIGMLFNGYGVAGAR